MTARNPTKIKGNQPMPPHEGPKGTSQIPPTHVKRTTITKNHRKLSQGPLVLKASETIQTNANPMHKATRISTINMNVSIS